MKLIFLDVDGVLNNNKFLKRLRWQHAPFDDEVLCGSLMIDKFAVKRLHKIVSETDAKIVISSSWREAFSLDEIRQMLDRKLDELHLSKNLVIIDKTPIDTTNRKNQIVEWLNDNTDKAIAAFVIFEDWAPMYDLEERTVRTSMKTGLTDFDVERAIKLLNGDTE